MRDNFRPNVRLATNILMVIGTFLIAINLASVGKRDKKFIQRRDDCADVEGRKITNADFVKKYGLNSIRESVSDVVVVNDFCRFYRFGI